MEQQLDQLKADLAEARTRWDSGDWGGAYGWLSRSVSIVLGHHDQVEEARDEWASQQEQAHYEREARAAQESYR